MSVSPRRSRSRSPQRASSSVSLKISAKVSGAAPPPPLQRMRAFEDSEAVSYTHLRAHETSAHL
eukprot:8279416-Alexandrium_andersonii.AAC.1